MLKLLNINVLVMFFLIILIILGTLNMPIPSIVENLFQNDIVRLLILSGIIYLGKYKLESAILLGALFLLISEKLINKEIEKYANI